MTKAMGRRCSRARERRAGDEENCPRCDGAVDNGGKGGGAGASKQSRNKLFPGIPPCERNPTHVATCKNNGSLRGPLIRDGRRMTCCGWTEDIAMMSGRGGVVDR